MNFGKESVVVHGDLQKFAYFDGKTLSMSSGIVSSVESPPDLRWLIAKNLRYFMDREKSLYRNANALAVAAKVAPNTVRNLLDPNKRTTTTEKPDGYPTIDKLERIGRVLGCEVWEILHPNIERSLREREFYSHIERDFKERGVIPHREAKNAKETERR